MKTMTYDTEFPVVDFATEFQNTLFRAFVTKHGKTVFLDGWDGPYLRACICWAVDQGWLNHKWHEEEQYSCHIFTLNQKGKKHFGLCNDVPLSQLNFEKEKNS